MVIPKHTSFLHGHSMISHLHRRFLLLRLGSCLQNKIDFFGEWNYDFQKISFELIIRRSELGELTLNDLVGILKLRLQRLKHKVFALRSLCWKCMPTRWPGVLLLLPKLLKVRAICSSQSIRYIFGVIEWFHISILTSFFCDFDHVFKARLSFLGSETVTFNPCTNVVNVITFISCQCYKSHSGSGQDYLLWSGLSERRICCDRGGHSKVTPSCSSGHSSSIPKLSWPE